jgi:hypothetical protein
VPIGDVLALVPEVLGNVPDGSAVLVLLTRGVLSAVSRSDLAAADPDGFGEFARRHGADAALVAVVASPAVAGAGLLAADAISDSLRSAGVRARRVYVPALARGTVWLDLDDDAISGFVTDPDASGHRCAGCAAALFGGSPQGER